VDFPCPKTSRQHFVSLSRLPCSWSHWFSFIAERHRARCGLRFARRANSSFRPRRLSSFSFSYFPESMLVSGLNCVPSVRQALASPIDLLLEESQLLQVLRRLRSARSFLEAALDRLVPCIGAESSCGVATAWNGELRTSRGRRLHLTRQKSRAAAASQFNRRTPRKSSSGSR
jgi:hypothetical protein